MTDFATYLPGFLAAYAILVVAASSPGPAVAMLLGIATNQGRKPALTASAGIASGSVLLNIGTLVGLGVIIAQAAWAMQIVRIIGAAYLLWLAWGAFKKAADPAEVKAASVAPVSAKRSFIMGFLLQVTNPKAIVFWLAINALGATQGGGPLVITAFVVGAWMISFGCHGGWALVLSSRPFRTAYNRSRRWIEASLGVFFGFMAFRLATAER